MHSHRIACIAQYVQVDMKACLVRGEILDTKSRVVRHQAGEVCRFHVLRSINAGHSNGDGGGIEKMMQLQLVVTKTALAGVCLSRI